MKFQEPENNNYAAVVTSIKSLTELENCDNVVGTPLFGFQGVVSKDTVVGSLGLFFPAETQLSEEYTSKNNLYRHNDLNEDKNAKGYIEDNRRVKAMKFRGHRSDCLFMPLSSLSYIKNFNPEDLKEGDTFDRIGDYEICNKYVVKKTYKERQLQKNKEKFVRVDKKFLPEHYVSDNYFRNVDVIPGERTVIVTQKLHGTSIRVGNTIVARQAGLLDKIARRLGVQVKETEFDYVFGSRKVIKDVNNPNQNHFYDTDIWTDEGKKLEGTIPENFLIYGELIGWTPQGGPIQKNYTYQIPVGTCELYVYRVAFVNGQGIVTDLSWDQVREFCTDRGLKHVPELWRGPMDVFNPNTWMDTRYAENGYKEAVKLDKESPCDEGVCIRLDGLAPYILKAKSPLFYEHETSILDLGEEDLESSQS